MIWGSRIPHCHLRSAPWRKRALIESARRGWYLCHSSPGNAWLVSYDRSAFTVIPNPLGRTLQFMSSYRHNYRHKKYSSLLSYKIIYYIECNSIQCCSCLRLSLYSRIIILERNGALKSRSSFLSPSGQSNARSAECANVELVHTFLNRNYFCDFANFIFFEISKIAETPKNRV